MKREQPPIRVKTGDTERVDRLLRELESFLDKPRATEILLGEWLHDASLPIPSPELLQFFAVELLFGFGRYERFFIAASHGRHEALRRFVAEMKFLSSDTMREIVSYAVARMNILSMSGAPKKSMHWWPIIRGLESEKILEETSGNHGKRLLTRHMIEVMTMRAVFQGDAPRLEGLVDVVRAGGVDAIFKPSSRQKIALQILRWNSYLTEKLGREPSQSEMQTFLLSLYPDLSDSSPTWTDARKSLRPPKATIRSRRMDKGQIVKLAREASELEALAQQGKGKDPTCRRVASWRMPPILTKEDDVQK